MALTMMLQPTTDWDHGTGSWDRNNLWPRLGAVLAWLACMWPAAVWAEPPARAPASSPAEDRVLQGRHSAEASQFFQNPPDHAQPELREQWDQLGIRDRYAHTVNPAAQEYFPDGRIDWQDESGQFSAFTDQEASSVRASPQLAPATRMYLHNAATGFVDYGRQHVIAEVRQRFEPEPVQQVREAWQEAQRPLAGARHALDSAADDVGRLTGVPNSQLKKAWNGYTRGLQDKLEQTMAAASAVGDRDFAGAAEAVEAVLNDPGYQQGVAGLVDAFFADLDVILAEWREELRRAAESVRLLPDYDGSPEAEASLDAQLEALLEETTRKADRMRAEARQQAAGTLAELRRSGDAAEAFRQSTQQISTQAERDQLSRQLQAVAQAFTSTPPAPQVPGSSLTSNPDRTPLYSVEINSGGEQGFILMHNLPKYHAEEAIKAGKGQGGANEARNRYVAGPYYEPR